MKILHRFISRIFSVFLGLYPRTFKDEFFSEMMQVFNEMLVDVSAGQVNDWKKTFDLVHLSLREFASLPRNLIHEYWLVIMGKEGNLMTQAAVTSSNPGSTSSSQWNEIRQSSWREALTAGLPQAVVSVIIIIDGLLPLLKINLPSTPGMGGEIAGYLFFLVALVCLVLAWKAHFPRWSGGWYAFWSLGGFMVVNLLLQLVSYRWDNLVSDFFAFVILVFLIATLLWMVTRHDRIQGIVFSLPIMWVFWLIQLEFVPQITQAFIEGATGLLITAGIVWMTRQGNVRNALWQALVIAALVGLPFAYAGNYLVALPSEASLSCCSPTFADTARTFLVGFFSLSCAVVAPLLAWGIKRSCLQAGKVGRLGAQLVIFGLLMIIFGCLGASRSYWLVIDYKMSSLMSPFQLFFNIIAYLGGIAWLAGAAFLVVTAENNTARRARTETTVLLGLSLGIPLTLILAAHFGGRNIPESMPYALELLNFLPRPYFLVIGCAWILLAAGMLTYLLTRQESKLPGGYEKQHG